MDVTGLLRVNDGNESAFQRTKSHKSLLCIGNTIVFVGKSDTIEYSIGIGKVEAVLPEICQTLSLVPVDHTLIVYTSRIFVNCGRSQHVAGLYEGRL